MPKWMLEKYYKQEEEIDKSNRSPGWINGILSKISIWNHFEDEEVQDPGVENQRMLLKLEHKLESLIKESAKAQENQRNFELRILSLIEGKS